MEFDIGDRVRWTIGPVRDSSDDAIVDPPIVMFYVRRPDGSVAISIYGQANQPYPVTRMSSGIYRAHVPLVKVGSDRRQKWVLRWNIFDEDGDPLLSEERLVHPRISFFEIPLPPATTE